MTLAPEALTYGLTESELDFQRRARAFVDEHLIPYEEQAELAHGKLPREVTDGIARAGLEAGFVGGLHRPEHGGQGWSHVEWLLWEEQIGRCTNGVSWHLPGAYNVLGRGTPAQIERYLKPALRGELRDAYAVTERDAGSDPSLIESTATARDGGYVIDGEKWFVTHGSVADVFIVMANVVDRGEPRPTLFLVDRDSPGIEIVDDPPFTHNYPDGHPTVRFTGVVVGADAVIGGVGGGDEVQRAWFSEERLGIAARCVGAMERLLEASVAWALEREQGGRPIYEYQGVSFPLAESAADAAAARALTLDVTRLLDAGADARTIHYKSSMVKLFASEAAWRCADRAVQVFGGRGYLRTNVAERFLRELRVDRIWEGTSEIQKLIIARGLQRHGVRAMVQSRTGAP